MRKNLRGFSAWRYEYKMSITKSEIMKEKWHEMINAFLALTPEERSVEAENRLDETLERMAEMYKISKEQAYEKLIKNRNRMYR